MATQHKIISVTGTKGKTTTVAVIADVLRALGNQVLKVDTTGHFINGERRSTLEDSKAIWGLVPSVCPGRYLYEFNLDPKKYEDAVAVLECSLGSSAPTMGLGYRYHTVGVFLNVFEDHLGSSERIKSKRDIAIAKEFVFSRIDQNQHGVAVFNADDELVVDRLSVLADKPSISLLPVGLEFSHFDAAAHLDAGGLVVTMNAQQQVVLRSKQHDIVLCDLKALPWTFDAAFLPAIWNIMSAAAAIVAQYDLTVPAGLRKALEAVRLDPYGGRLTVLRNSDNVTIIADYAHEKQSLAQIGQLAKRTATGKTVGVVRLAHDRTDQLLQETGHVIAQSFDEVIVYDKIDGHWRKPQIKKLRFPQIVGRTSEIVAQAAAERNPQVTRIIREDEALAHAAKIARPGDVVVHIVNDDIRQSVQFIKDSFNAEFV